MEDVELKHHESSPGFNAGGYLQVCHRQNAYLQGRDPKEKVMRNPDKGNESSIVGMVAELERNDIHLLILNNAQQVGYRLNDEHFEVIDTLIEHYRHVGWTGDYPGSSRQIRFLAKRFLDRGGSRYLHQLFNEDEGSCGVLRAIRSLVAVPQSGYGDGGDSCRPPAEEKPVRSTPCKRGGRRTRKPVTTF
jgi:sulfur relay (sulfurtransferase) DsrC/TusE family protein